jgi:hypothetical protein
MPFTLVRNFGRQAKFEWIPCTSCQKVWIELAAGHATECHFGTLAAPVKKRRPRRQTAAKDGKDLRALQPDNKKSILKLF